MEVLERGLVAQGNRKKEAPRCSQLSRMSGSMFELPVAEMYFKVIHSL